VLLLTNRVGDDPVGYPQRAKAVRVPHKHPVCAVVHAQLCLLRHCWCQCIDNSTALQQAQQCRNCLKSWRRNGSKSRYTALRRAKPSALEVMASHSASWNLPTTPRRHTPDKHINRSLYSSTQHTNDEAGSSSYVGPATSRLRESGRSQVTAVLAELDLTLNSSMGLGAALSPPVSPRAAADSNDRSADEEGDEGGLALLRQQLSAVQRIRVEHDRKDALITALREEVCCTAITLTLRLSNLCFLQSLNFHVLALLFDSWRSSKQTV
jgi:hypothetical protein